MTTHHGRGGNDRMLMALSDHQLALVIVGANGLPVDKRDVYLQRIAAMLAMRGRFTDADVSDVVRLAMAGLIHQTADSAA
jgi:hypothetical protein